MRSYCAVHVDVGYLLASAATYVTGSSLRRGVVVDYPTLIARLVEQAETDSGLPLLRVNWYDSGARPGGMPDYQQEEIGLLPRVKLRLGRLSYSGDQKGVDIRIGLDLAIQGRNRVADAVYLVSGDDDLTEAVEEAQSHGVQVVLLAVADRAGRPHGVSKHLRREVDGLLLVDAETIGATVRSVAIPEELLPDGAKGDAPAAEVAPAQEPPVAIEEATAQCEGVEPAADPVETGTPVPMAEAPLTPSADVPPAAPSADTSPARAAGLPSPAAFARRRATGLVLPGGDPHVEIAVDPETGVTEEVVDGVAKRLVASWCATSTPEQLAGLREAAPTIPAELDRALLVDLASRAQDHHVGDDVRQHLRDRFWAHVGRIRME